MRPILVIPGLILLAMGAVWALQGAGYVPTSFMVGPTWIALGSVVAVAGAVLAALGVRRPRP